MSVPLRTGTVAAPHGAGRTPSAYREYPAAASIEAVAVCTWDGQAGWGRAIRALPDGCRTSSGTGGAWRWWVRTPLPSATRSTTTATLSAAGSGRAPLARSSVGPYASYPTGRSPSTCSGDRARSFYIDALGLELGRDDSSIPGLRWVQVAPPGGGTQLTLVNWAYEP